MPLPAHPFWLCKQNSFLYLFIYANPVRFNPSPCPPAPPMLLRMPLASIFYYRRWKILVAYTRGHTRALLIAALSGSGSLYPSIFYLTAASTCGSYELCKEAAAYSLPTALPPAHPVGLSKHNTQYVHRVALREICAKSKVLSKSQLLYWYK